MDPNDQWQDAAALGRRPEQVEPQIGVVIIVSDIKFFQEGRRRQMRRPGLVHRDPASIHEIAIKERRRPGAELPRAQAGDRDQSERERDFRQHGRAADQA